MGRYVQQCYIRKLVQLFRTCEELKNLEGLRLMFKIVKGISEFQHRLLTDFNLSSSFMVSLRLPPESLYLLFSFACNMIALSQDSTGFLYMPSLESGFIIKNRYVELSFDLLCMNKYVD